MVPILDRSNRETGKFKETIADRLLAPYDYDLSITVEDESGNEMIIPVWRFVERYLRIKDKNGHFVVFEINEAQCEMYIELCEQKRQGKPMRIDILKARQLGFSTFIAAVIFVLTILVPNQTACIVADIADHASNLFKKYKFYYLNLPKFFKDRLPLIASNAKELVVDYGNGQTSNVRVLVQGENAGRSDTCQYLHLSEVAFWQNIEDTTTSILQTVDDNNPNSIIAYETTANGVNDYKTTWDADFGGNTGYKALFFAWYLDPKNVRPYDGFELFDWEKRLMEQYDLTLEQISWYRSQFNKFRGNLDKLRQEFPSSPVEAFIVSGTSMFNLQMVLAQKDVIMRNPPKRVGFFSFHKEVSIDGNQIVLKDIHWVESETGAIKIYEDPKKGTPYVVNNDPAMGGEDFFATQVIDNTNCHQVAVYHKNKCDADEVAFQMYCLAKHYNNALAGGETNTTAYILKTVLKCGHKFIYREQDYEALNGRYQDRLGYKTKQNNRQFQLESFAETFRDDPGIIVDYETICEMETFVIMKNETTGKEKAQASRGSHDDLVMSFAGFFLIRNAQSCIANREISSNQMSFEELDERVRRNQEACRKRQTQVKGQIVWD